MQHRGASARHVAARSVLAVGLLTLVSMPLAPGALAAEATASRTPKAEAARKATTVQKGVATYYAKRFHGRLTASGERLDQGSLTAAHPTLPFGTVVRVTNLRNSRSTEVRVVDRGPAKGPQRKGVIIDLTQAAARELGFREQGKAPVHVQVLGQGSRDGEPLAPWIDSPA